jgi:hypothetical protein
MRVTIQRKESISSNNRACDLTKLVDGSAVWLSESNICIPYAEVAKTFQHRNTSCMARADRLAGTFPKFLTLTRVFLFLYQNESGREGSASKIKWYARALTAYLQNSTEAEVRAPCRFITVCRTSQLIEPTLVSLKVKVRWNQCGMRKR